MDIGKSFRFAFDDKEWVKKFLIGLLVSIVPILNLAWNGYLVQLVRNVSDGEELPLPEWDDFGDKFMKGLILAVVVLIYALPALLLAIIPLLGGAAASFSSGDAQDVIGGIFAGVGVLLSCIILIYSLVLTFYLPAVYIHFSREGTFGSCFEFGKIIALIRENLGEYLTAWVVALLFGIGISIVAAILFTILTAIICIGWILEIVLAAFLAVWPLAVIAHMFGQVGALGSAVEMTVSE